jgi:hypothetical protein
VHFRVCDELVKVITLNAYKKILSHKFPIFFSQLKTYEEPSIIFPIVLTKYILST